MGVPDKCDVCGDRHHKHQAHRFPKPVAVTTTLEYLEAGGTFQVSVEPAVQAPKPRIVASACEVCGKEFDTKRRDARFCSAKCRQASSRKRRSGVQKQVSGEDSTEART